MSTWIDITRPVDETLVTWSGRSRPLHRWEKRLTAGDHCNVSFWQMSAHSGTHMDAPLHFIEGGKSIDQVPPDVFIGECQVVDRAALRSSVLDENTAQRYAGAKRLLIKTSHSQLHPDGRYEAHAALMSEQAANVLLAGGLILIGTDRLSVDDSEGNSFSLHHRFLGAGCVIVEGLLLCDIREGSFFLSATPLLLTGTEASPVRAFLKRRDSTPPGGSPHGFPGSVEFLTLGPATAFPPVGFSRG